MHLVPSWYEWYISKFNTSGQNGVDEMITSRLLSRDTIANQFMEVAEILVHCGGAFCEFTPAPTYLTLTFFVQHDSGWEGISF